MELVTQILMAVLVGIGSVIAGYLRQLNKQADTLAKTMELHSSTNAGEHKQFKETLDTHGQRLDSHGDRLDGHDRKFAMLIGPDGKPTGPRIEVEMQPTKEQPA